jgi:hypothetical protein
MESGPSVVPELRNILLSASEATFYDPGGRLPEIREMPFPHVVFGSCGNSPMGSCRLGNANPSG